MWRDDAVKYRQILESLKADIVSGRLGPGDRLPTRTDLIRRFSASSVTIQKACHVLLNEGFIITAGARGSFVADQPPHLHRVGLAFIGHPRHGGAWWTRFHDAMLSQIAAVHAATGLHVKPYFHVEGRGDGSERRELLEDISEQRLSGVVFAGGLHDLGTHPVITETSIPLATIATQPVPGLRCAYPDLAGFMQRAMRALAQAGRKRVALLSIAEPDSGEAQRFMQLAGEYGLDSRRAWVQTVWPQLSIGARPIVELLMDPENTHRPDALIISDDNLVEHACRGLELAGVKVGPGGECDVVAHANFPQPMMTHLPIQRIGFDIRELLQTLVEQVTDPSLHPEVAVVPAIDEATFNQRQAPNTSALDGVKAHPVRSRMPS